MSLHLEGENSNVCENSFLEGNKTHLLSCEVLNVRVDEKAYQYDSWHLSLWRQWERLKMNFNQLSSFITRVSLLFSTALEIVRSCNTVNK